MNKELIKAVIKFCYATIEHKDDMEILHSAEADLLQLLSQTLVKQEQYDKAIIDLISNINDVCNTINGCINTDVDEQLYVISLELQILANRFKDFSSPVMLRNKNNLQ